LSIGDDNVELVSPGSLVCRFDGERFCSLPILDTYVGCNRSCAGDSDDVGLLPAVVEKLVNSECQGAVA